MAKLINSTKTKLTMGEILVVAADNQNTEDYPTATALALLTKEIQLMNMPPVQIGNTVFVGQRGEGDNADVMVGRALNADTPNNLIKNAVRYVRYIQSRNITKYITEYYNNTYDPVFIALQRQLEKDGTTVVFRKYENATRVFILDRDAIES